MTSKKSIPASPAAEVMMARGWLCGKFAMPHMGHINHIHQAATQVKELYVVVSQDDARFNDPRLSLRNRMLWMKTIFKDMPHIKIISVDETGIPSYPNGWQQWSDLVKGVLPNVEFDAVFTSEISDAANYEKYFDGHTKRVVMVDPERKGVHISATEIRNDMVKHWSMMPTVVRKDFVSKVCIVGTESVGKTSLTKMLAKAMQTSWVEEYGRTYCEQNLCMDESLLKFEDYGHIAAKRYEMEQQAILAANRVMFADTAALSTNFFCLMYEGRENPLVTAYAEMEQYDMFIYLEDDVEWVADGLRKNTERDYTRKLFLTMLKAYAARKGIPIVRVSGNYNQRLNKSIEAVRTLLAQPLSLS